MRCPAAGVLLLTISIIIIGDVNSADDLIFECPADWLQEDGGPQCYRVFDSQQQWEDAAQTCSNYGARLVSVTGFQQNRMLAEWVKDTGHISVPFQYWIGARRDDNLGSDDDAAIWDQNDASLAKSLRHGYWGQEGPSDATSGDCVMVEFQDRLLYKYAWKLADCHQSRAFICEATACLQGYFRCASGNCIQQKFVCDVTDDCSDGSSLNNCPSANTEYLTGSSGVIATDSDYPNQDYHLWTVETPVGTRVKLEFTRFETEPGLDEAQIWIGGPTEESCTLLTRLSGSPARASQDAFYSNNNFMIVKWFSDATVPETGFEATWSAVSQQFGDGNRLTADTAPQELLSPRYPDGLAAGLRETWIITTRSREIITLQINDLDLGEGDYVKIQNGEGADGVILYDTRYDSNPVVMSTNHTMSVILQTTMATTARGFNFTYTTGCQVRLMSMTGVIASPGYGVTEYADLQTCSWHITNPLSRTLGMRLESDSSLEADMDYLLVYDGSSPAQPLILNKTGFIDSVDVTSTGPELFVVMTTSAIIGDVGFKVVYASSCPELVFNNDTILDPEFPSTDFGASFTVTCPEGLAFGQAEFTGSSATVVTCTESGWNVGQIPQCERVYCGMTPIVPNGFVTSSNGSSYGDVTRYDCFGGYGIDGSDVITCQADASWTLPPSCEPVSCGKLVDVDDADLELVAGNGTFSYGDLFEYRCHEGFQLAGVPRWFCQSDGQWSAEQPPHCVKLECYLEAPAHGTLDKSDFVSFGDVVTVTCDQGYATVNGTVEMICSSNRMLEPALRCQDINECDEAAHGCDVNTAMCVNTDGSYDCQCREGFEPDVADTTTCTDVDECLLDLSNCNETCTNTIGGYVCSCQAGYQLYIANGTEGFIIPATETGMAPGDTLYINHTCVPEQCDSPGYLGNGTILSSMESFHFADEVHFLCDLGFTLEGSSNITCQEEKVWSDPWPLCQPAVCEVPDTAGLRYPPEFEPRAGSIPYLGEIQLNCSQYRPGDEIFRRMCIYDPESDSYRFQPEGLECPVLSCGQRPFVAGSENATSDERGTLYGQIYEVQCLPTHTLEGATGHPDGNTTVECVARGDSLGVYWTIGDISCEGPLCSDPGTPPGGVQHATTYDVGSSVTFNCSRPGFEPSSAAPLICQAVNTTYATWSDSLPECLDVTPPELGPCVANVPISRLTKPGFALPGASDNSRAVKSLTWTPDSFHPDLALDTNTTVTFTARDFSGLESQCTTAIRIKDYILPEITCPEPFTVYMTQPNHTEVFDDLATATDLGADPSVTYDPPALILDENDVGAAFVVMATAEDSDGNNASCRFIVNVEAKCTFWSLPLPSNGRRECEVTPGGARCLLTCDDGYYFRDEPHSERTMNCTTDAPWTKAPDCVFGKAAPYFGSYGITYSPGVGQVFVGGDVAVCEAHYRTELSRSLVTWASELSVFIGENILFNPSLNLSAVVDVDWPSVLVDNGTVSANISFEIKPRDLTDTEKQDVAAVIVLRLERQPDAVINNLTGDGRGCPEVTRDLSSTVLQEAHVCSPDERLLMQENNNVCLVCPIGTFAQAGSCVACQRGFYQDQVGQYNCTPCGIDTWTYEEGGKSEEDCRDTCQYYGMMSRSDDGLPPCVPCDVDFYLVNSTHCAGCPSGTSTVWAGAQDVSECLDLCPRGSYSDTGYTPCTQCPQNFYSDGIGLTTCTACPDGFVTMGPGANDSTQCQDSCDALCNNGTCQIIGHRVTCLCQAGYTGENCEDEIDFCLSQPCYYGGACDNILDGYTCDCASGTTGDRCEVEVDHCVNATCENRGQCQDQVGDYACLCFNGTTGSRCETEIDICTGADPCKNGGTCVSLSVNRVQCRCANGYSGEYCETEIDECGSNPCQLGATCIDGVDSFTCQCVEGTSGTFCEEYTGFCRDSRAPCAASDTCFEDHRLIQPGCVCGMGYEAENMTLADETWAEDIQGISLGIGCQKTDHCRSNPCENGATCSWASTGPQCACAPGYGGALCQHENGLCRMDTCRNGGTCVDEAGGFNCTCATGFIGLTCNLTDPCVATEPCDPDHSTCDPDLTGDYTCLCDPGWSGKNCTDDVDECLARPCLRNATCTNLENDFTCECPTGWEGKTCENITDSCAPGVCFNDGECVSGFSSENFCRCLGRTHGQNCSEEASTCEAANPCYHGSSCTEDLLGSTTCACDLDYTGEGCELLVSHCLVQDFCLHGGTCVSSVGNFHCACAADYTGERCEVSRDDCPSDGSVCGSGTCVDGLFQYDCHCPINMTGETCNKAVDTDYDIYFHWSSRRSMASRRIPFLLNSTALSLGMWVRFSDKGGQGTFFSLFGLDEQYTAAGPRELLQISHEGVMLGGGTLLPFGSYVLNDGRWYYTLVTWDGVTDRLEVKINTILVISRSGIGMGARQPEFGWVALGSRWDPAKESALEGSGFHGYLSQVNVWGVALNATSPGVNDMQVDRAALVFEGLLARWAEYRLDGGAIYRWPSTAGDRDVCAEGYSGANCDTRLPNRVPPTVDCPGDVVRYSPHRLTLMQWDDPTVTYGGHGEQLGSPRALHDNGQVFLWGQYRNAYVAFDTENNAGICTFDFFVQYQDCPTPADPYEGTQTCSVENSPAFETCTPTCNQGRQVSLLTPSHYTCGPLGAYNVWNKYLGFRYPACAPAREARVEITMEVIYRGFTLCGPGFRVEILKNLDQVNRDWSYSICGSGCCGNGTHCEPYPPNVNISDPCLLRAGTQATVTIVISDLSPLITSTQDKTKSLAPDKVLASEAFDFGLFELGPAVRHDEVPPQDIQINSEDQCGAQGVIINGTCVVCGLGTFYNETSEYCENCPLGSYSDATNQTGCMSCGPGMMTQLPGSQSPSDCHGSCEIGHFLNITTGLCQPCAIGLYQDQPDQYYCQPCNVSTTTESEGSTSIGECLDLCTNGTELSQEGVCTNCSQGTYRKVGLQDRCVKCPPGTSTPSTGSVTEAECTLAFNPCMSGEHDCKTPGECVFNDNNPGQFTCRCGPYWQGNYPNCSHMCDGSYCKNGGTCTKAGDGSPQCTCTKSYEGPTCAEWKDNLPLIIGASVGGLIGLLVLILAVVLGCWCCREKAHRKSTESLLTPSMADGVPGLYPEGYGYGYGGAGTAPSLVSGMRSMAFFQAQTPATSLAGYDAREGGNDYTNPATVGIHNGTHENKTSEMNFGGEDSEEEEPASVSKHGAETQSYTMGSNISKLW